MLARARRDYDLVRAEMLRLARAAWNEWLPGQSMPDDGDETIRRVLDAIARQHPQPDELIDVNRAEIERIDELRARAQPHAPADRAAPDHLDAGLHARLRPCLPAVAGAARQGPAQLLLDHAARP